MIRIYVQNKPLILVDKITEEVESYLHKSEAVFFDGLKTSAVTDALNELKKPSISGIVFQHSNPIELLNAFKSHLKLIKAGGGLVYTEAKELLLIFRKGKWDLPKGKLDEGESLMECAEREVKEETGIGDLKIIQPLNITYHTYYEKEKHILKESHWYLMETKNAEPLIPQTEEDIEQCLWVALQDVSKFIGNMHASIIDVIHEGQRILNEKD